MSIYPKEDWVMFIYMDDRLGFVDTEMDEAYVMDDYGNIIHVSFTIGQWYFQEH